MSLINLPPVHINFDPAVLTQRAWMFGADTMKNSIYVNIPADLADDDTDRIFGIGCEIDASDKTWLGTSPWSHTVALYGAVLAGGAGKADIWGLNTVVQNADGFNKSQQGYECDVNQMYQDVGQTQAEIHRTLGINAVSGGTKHPGAAFCASAVSSAASWQVGLFLDSPFNLAAIVISDAAPISWKNNVTGNYEERIKGAAADLNFYAGSGGALVMNSQVNMMLKKIISLAEPTANSDAATKYYADNVLGASYQLLSEKDVNNGYAALNSAGHLLAPGSGVFPTAASDNIIFGDRTTGYSALLMTRIPGTGAHYFKGYINKGTTGDIWDEIITLASSAILSSAQKTDLTNSGDSTLHYHASDRALANATGTLADAKIASTICRDSELSAHVSAYGHLSTAQKTDLTDSGNSSAHYHSSDRSLNNATGQLESDLTWNKSNPGMVFDTNDSMYYDKTLNRLNVVIGGTIRAYCDNTGWH